MTGAGNIFLMARALALACRGHHQLVLENLSLRQQLKRFEKHREMWPHLARRDRLVLIVLAMVRVWSRTSNRCWCPRCTPAMSWCSTIWRPSSKTDVRTALERVGGQIRFPPPYSPDFNRIQTERLLAGAAAAQLRAGLHLVAIAVELYTPG
jgi:hypothetical protein